MEQEIFADGVGSIIFSGGVMRIDLMSMIPGQREESNNQQLVFRQRIIMPVEGFFNSFRIFQEIIGKMEQSGLVDRQVDGSGGKPTASPVHLAAAVEIKEAAK
jgi:hypothetical protein